MKTHDIAALLIQIFVIWVKKLDILSYMLVCIKCMLFFIHCASILSLFGSGMCAIVCTALQKKDKGNKKMKFSRKLLILLKPVKV